MEPTINFCSSCGAPVSFRVPDGDSLPRHVCDRCGVIHYRNPKLVVGSLPVWEDRVLLCRRAIEPRYGKWTLPAGFMELDESMAQGAARETAEEAGAQIEMGPFFSAMSIPRIGQVHVFYLARLLSEHFDPGPESAQVHLFTEDEVPWDELAFTAVRRTLECFFADRRRGQFGVHDFDIA